MNGKGFGLDGEGYVEVIFLGFKVVYFFNGEEEFCYLYYRND